MASMKIEVSENHELILSDVFSGIGIKTDQGRFGIVQRDEGIEIVKDGKLVWSSTRSVAPQPASVSVERPFTPRVIDILRRADEIAYERGADALYSLDLLLGMITGEEWAESQAGEVFANVGCAVAMRAEASSMAHALERKEQGAAKESAAPKPEPKEEKWNVHDWQKTCICKNCGMEWNQGIEHGDCSGDDPGERALTQLAGCLVAAEGNATGTNDAEKGDYGWSPAFQAVKDLWNESEGLANTLRKMRGDAQVRERRMRNLDGSLEIAVERNQKLRRDLEKALKTIDELRKQRELKAEQTSVQAAKLAEENMACHDEIAELRKSLDAERAANANKTQIILGQCRERRTICEMFERLPAEIRLGPEISILRDKLEGLERTTVRTVSSAGLKPKTVMELTVMEIEDVNTSDVTSPAAEEKAPDPCDPERIKDKLVIRFDGLPGPEPAGFVETELNGKGIRAGEWVQDGEYWLLVIEPEAIPSQKRPGDLATRRDEHIRALELERNRLKKSYAKARNGVLAKTPCKCGYESSESLESKIHAQICPLGIALTEFPRSP